MAEERSTRDARAIDWSGSASSACFAPLPRSRWVLQHQALAQLLFWRPVPNFEPSAEAFAPSEEIARLQQQAVADAVDAGQLGPEALQDAGIVVSILIKGVLTQAMANEPHLQWGEGRYTPTFPKLMTLLAAAYPPPTNRTSPSRRRARS
jgi:hypothetical protein